MSFLQFLCLKNLPPSIIKIYAIIADILNDVLPPLLLLNATHHKLLPLLIIILGIDAILPLLTLLTLQFEHFQLIIIIEEKEHYYC